PHREHVHAADLPSEPLAWPGWPGGAAVEELSRDEDTGAVSALVTLPGGYRRPAGHLPADSEALVLSGSLRVGGVALEPSSFEYVPPGAAQEEWEAGEETELLFMTRTGPPAFVAAPGRADDGGRIRLHGSKL